MNNLYNINEAINQIQKDLKQLENGLEIIEKQANRFIFCLTSFLVILAIDFVIVYKNYEKNKDKNSLLNDIFYFYVIDIIILIVFIYFI